MVSSNNQRNENSITYMLLIIFVCSVTYKIETNYICKIIIHNKYSILFLNILMTTFQIFRNRYKRKSNLYNKTIDFVSEPDGRKV